MGVKFGGNEFNNLNNLFDKASQFGDSTTLNQTIQGKESHVQAVNPEAVQAAVRHDFVDSRKGMNGQVENKLTPVGRRGRPLPNQKEIGTQPASVEQAQSILAEGADRLSLNARQFQNFLTGGVRGGRTHWAQTQGTGSNITSQLLRANIALRFRG